jgi:hypothetical protein
MIYPYSVYDDVIPAELQTKVWEYIQHQKFYASRKDRDYPNPGTIMEYYPFEEKKEYLDSSLASVNNQFMHRCIFGDNEMELMKHPPILNLWLTINKFLDNSFKIAGAPESIAIKAPKGRSGVTSRVYVNAQPDESIKRSHGVHRDTIDLNETKNYTLLYIANPEWYPTWFGENIFYEDNIESNDKQQFQKGYGQSRGFGVGEPYAVVLPKPGRIILYDGRTLHTTRPVAVWAKQMRYAVVFRIEKVS